MMAKIVNVRIKKFSIEKQLEQQGKVVVKVQIRTTFYINYWTELKEYQEKSL